MKYLLLLLQFLGFPVSWWSEPSPAPEIPAHAERTDGGSMETGRTAAFTDHASTGGAPRAGRGGDEQTNRGDAPGWETCQPTATEQPVDDISNGF